ncbi:MAG: hypothetical protein H7Z39_09105 [Burkholderiaceae bacterium]|nr:hypothetical protein [Burkholderiaceae bacterium]
MFSLILIDNNLITKRVAATPPGRQSRPQAEGNARFFLRYPNCAATA